MSDIKDKAINGAKWTLVEQTATLGLQFLIGIIVARLVSPADYGIIAMLGLFIALGNVFINSGFNIALIRKKNVTQTDYSTSFYFNLLTGFLIYAFLFVCAPLIADFYDTPILTNVCRLYTLTLPIGALTIVQIAKLTHELKFKIQFNINIVSLIISGILGIIMAYRGYGVWALVCQGLSSSIIRTFLYCFFCKWYPSFCFAYNSFKYLFSFGSKMLITNVIDTLYDNIYTLVVGKFYSAASAGYYNRSLQISQLPQGIISQVVYKVALPVLAPYQDDNRKLLQIYRKMFRVTVFFSYPMMVLLIVLAKPIIYLMLGDKWLPSVPYLQILSCSVIFIILTAVNINLFFVKGCSDIVLKIDILKKIIGFAIVFIMAPLGLEWICFGTILYAFFAFVINCYQTNKILNFGIVQQSKEAFPALLCSVLMGFIVYLSVLLFNNSLIQLLAGLFVGIISYIVLMWVIENETVSDIVSYVKERYYFGIY